MGRHGGTPKVIAGVVFFFGLVYLIYIYNDVSGRLKDTEHTAERYRRESESVAAQLSVEYELKGRLQKALLQEKQNCKASIDELTVAQQDLRQKCDTDKNEFTNRLTALQQQHKMLKSQHEDMQSEYHKLQKEHEDEAEDHRLIDDQRNQEYNQFKQEKVLEVSNLKDQVANYEREKVQLTEEIAELKRRLQESFNQIQTDQQSIANLQQEVMNYKKLKLEILKEVSAENKSLPQNQFALDQQTITNLQTQIYNLKNAAALQQQNLVAQGGVHQGGNVQQQANLQQGNIQQGLQQGNLLQQGDQQGQFMQQLLRNKQFMQPGGAQQGILHQNLNQPVFEQQQQPQGQQQGVVGGQNFNIFGQQQFVPGNQLRGNQEIHPTVKKDSKEEAERVMKEQEHHQIKPPGGADSELHEKEGLGHQKLGQDMIGLQPSKDKDIHDDGSKQIGRPNFNINLPMDGKDVSEDRHEGALGLHDNRIENQGPVNLQVQEPVIKDHAELDRPIVGDANMKFRPIMPEDVQQQVQPQAHDDTIKKEQIDHPLLQQQELRGHIIDDNKNEEKNLGPLEQDDDGL